MVNLNKISVSEKEALITKCINQIKSTDWAADFTKLDRHDINMFVDAQIQIIQTICDSAELFEYFITTAWNAVVLKNNVVESSPEASLVKQYLRVCITVLNGGRVRNTYVTVNECWRWLKRIETSAISENLEALLGIQDFELIGGESNE